MTAGPMGSNGAPGRPGSGGPRIRTRLYPVLLTRVPPLWAGVAGAAVIAFTLYLVFAVSLAQGNPYAHRYSVHARFANAINLGANDFVEVHGVRVGRVGGLTAVDGLADVVLRIDDPGVRLHDDATAALRLKSLVGESYVEVDPGTPGRPELPDGALLPAAQTRSPVQLDQVLDALDPATRGALSRLVVELGAGVQDRAGDLAGLVQRADPALGASAGAAGALDAPQLGDLVASLDRDAGVLAARTATLTGILRHGDRFLGALATDTANLQAVIGDAADTLARVDSVLRDRSAGLGAGLDQLDAVTRSTGTLADQARPLVDALTPELPALATWLRELASATSQTDANHYFLRLVPVVAADSASGARGVTPAPGASPGRGGAVAARGAAPPPLQGLPGGVAGLIDLLYGG
jgi:phospholipid/cholesterol/gamma-HCH transport system substrate-binding protein